MISTPNDWTNDSLSILVNQLLSSCIGGWWLVAAKVGKFSKTVRVLSFRHHTCVKYTLSQVQKHDFSHPWEHISRYQINKDPSIQLPLISIHPLKDIWIQIHCNLHYSRQHLPHFPLHYLLHNYLFRRFQPYFWH